MKSSTVNVVEQTVERDHVDLCLALEQVESWTGSFREAGTDVAFDSQMKRFRADDVLFGKLRPYLAKVVRPDRDGLCVGEFLVLRPRTIGATVDAGGYLEHILRFESQSLTAIPVFDLRRLEDASRGYGLTHSGIKSVALPLPPLSDEQTAIVRHLDHLAKPASSATSTPRSGSSSCSIRAEAGRHQSGCHPGARSRCQSRSHLASTGSATCRRIGRFGECEATISFPVEVD